MQNGNCRGVRREECIHPRFLLLRRQFVLVVLFLVIVLVAFKTRLITIDLLRRKHPDVDVLRQGRVQHDVQFRENILGSKDMKFSFFPLSIGEVGTPVGQLGVRRLGVVHRQGGRGVAVQFVRLVERDPVDGFAFEEVVGLHRGSDDAEVRAADIFPLEGIVVEGIIEGCVLRDDGNLGEEGIAVPGDNPFVLQAVRQGESLEDTRSVLPDAVADGLQAVLDCIETVHLALFAAEFLVGVVAFAGGLVQTGIP